MKNKKNKSGKPVNISGIEPSLLNDWIQQDETRRAAIKCQALIALTEGVSVTDVCNVLNVTRESLRMWRNRLKQEGPQGLIAHKKKGKTSSLTVAVKKDLQKIVLLEPIKLGYDARKWNGILICRYLKDKWNIEIAVRTVQNWLTKTGIRKVKRKRLG